VLARELVLEHEQDMEQVLVLVLNMVEVLGQAVELIQDMEQVPHMDDLQVPVLVVEQVPHMVDLQVSVLVVEQAHQRVLVQR
jgi:hypothetical protein